MKFLLSDGRRIPAVGLGTYKMKDEEVKDIIDYALLEAGYQHIDAAWIYENERPIGQAVNRILDSGKLKREDIWITSKCWNDSHERSQVMSACKRSLENLGLEYLDLYLVHWPMGYSNDPESGLKISDVDYLETWKGMEDVFRAGLAKSIGVSNFNIDQLERLHANCNIKPAVNQFEVHPYLSNCELVDYCKSQSVHVTAYTPIGKGGSSNLSKDPVLVQLSYKYNKTWAQIALRYNIQRGISVVPKTSNKDRLVENISIFDFELTGPEMDAIRDIDREQRMVTFDATKNHPFYPFEEPKD
ncbi:1,5-anhydro-D-fructose reductase-like isoform X2 [Tetranychus urticae]|uniref:1,5-anhydro-D-fructose reductase-like isoform X1 n=1 Tax=Tetranychus urticae TaxID=32264 RepID=UPI00077BE7AF|nr:1,5-anhydro-D-fructose reductase-like isoform X1 [Tetranychus urticae]XP_015795082.1 1,5-anhydro-D-fructose reductase-like isoform X2 [Tetranychus urticae]